MVRFKNRYLLAELRWGDGDRPETVTGYNLLNAIKDSLQYNFGDFGVGSNLQSLQGELSCVARALLLPLWLCSRFSVALR